MTSFEVQHSHALMAFIRSVDPRWAAVAEDQADARARSWAVILEDVDPGWALQYAKRFYSTDQRERLAPGMIRQAWMADQRVDLAKQRERDETGVPVPESLAQFMREAIRLAAAGQDPGQLPPPASARHMTKVEDLRSRLCRYWQGCACDHTKCRDGWLDEEQTFIGSTGLSYSGVRACPHCHDAAIMAAEPVMKGKRR